MLYERISRSLACHYQTSFLWRTTPLESKLLKCKFVFPSSHQPPGLDNKFSHRFAKMKRPVIFRRCESHFSYLQCVRLQKGNTDKRGAFIFSIWGMYKDGLGARMKKKKKSHTALVLSWLLHHFTHESDI